MESNMEDHNSPTSSRLPRRQVLQWFAAAAPVAATGLPALSPARTAPALGTKGYGTDPDLIKEYNPGDVWPLTFTDDQRKTVTALSDIVLPADEYGPAASTVRVHDYLDEWVSAPYPNQQRDRKVFMPGLEKFEAWVKENHSAPFAELSAEQQTAVCEAIATGKEKSLSAFFDKFVMLACGAYYSTMEGWKAIGYVGNIASVTFDGPPPEVLEKVGVEQTVEN